MEVCTNNTIGNVDIIENWVQLDVVVQAYNPVFQKSKQKGTEFWTSHRCKARSRENIKPELWGNISSLLLTAEFSWHMLAKITFSYHRTKKQVYSIPKGIHFHCLNNNTKWPLGFHGNTLKVKRYFHLRCVQAHFFLKRFLLFWTVIFGSVSTASGPILSPAHCQSMIWDGSWMGCNCWTLSHTTALSVEKGNATPWLSQPQPSLGSSLHQPEEPQITSFSHWLLFIQPWVNHSRRKTHKAILGFFSIFWLKLDSPELVSQGLN